MTNEEKVAALYERVARAEEAVTKLGEQVEQLEKELGAVPHWLRQRADQHEALSGVGPAWAASLREAAEEIERGEFWQEVALLGAAATERTKDLEDKIARAPCLVAREGETTYECRVDSLCRVCRWRNEP
jgi:hypothetical protein